VKCITGHISLLSWVVHLQGLVASLHHQGVWMSRVTLEIIELHLQRLTTQLKHFA
jgi:hypothetical protein